MAAASRPFTAIQPFKIVWVLLAIVTTSARLPFWLLYYLPKSLRQHPKWSYKQALLNQILKTVIYHSSIVRVKTTLSLAPGSEKDRFAVVKPAAASHYQGILVNPDIKPEPLGGTWFGDALGERKTIVLHFHGGAYVVGTGRTQDFGFGAKVLVKHIGRTFTPDYRLCSNAGGQFPAALQDAVTAYQYVLGQGAENVVISGDSAGGNLAIALLRYITDTGSLPSPAAALLWSPWVDLVSAQDPKLVDSHPKQNSDYLPGVLTSWGVSTFVPTTMKASDPYISPLHHPFSTKTPVWIQVCGAEIIGDDGISFARELESIEGNIVSIHLEPNASHDVLLMGNMTGFEMEADNAGKAAGQFLKTLGI